MVDVKHLSKGHASQNIPLNFEEAYQLGAYALKGCDQNASLAQIQSIAMLSALHNMAAYRFLRQDHPECPLAPCIPANAAEQIAGVCAAVFELDIAKSEFGFLNPNVPYAMDNCGMGGDLVVTANVSTLAALIAATAGIHMLKHGSPSNADQGRHGSSDFISLLGINTMADKSAVEKSVEDNCFGYTEALDTRYKKIHLQTHDIAKLPHMNDIIGPITSPLNPKLMTRRLVGVNHLIPPRIVAEAYLILNEKGVTNLEHGLFVRGFIKKDGYEGVDEVSVCPGGTQVAELHNGVITEYHLYASHFGLETVSPEDISPPKGMSKGDFSLAILKGEHQGGALKMVLANAAMLFYLAGVSKDLTLCYDMASLAYHDGNPYSKMLSVRESMPVGVGANAV